MTDNRKVLAGLILLAAFVLIVFYTPTIFESGIPVVCIEDGVCQHEQYLESLITYIPAILVIGFVIGIISAYLYFERKVEIPTPSVNRLESVLLLLNPFERKIIKRIVDDGGSSLQSDISRLEGIGKVRAHRTIDKLIRRGVLEKEEKGKTNVLKLKKEIMDSISCKITST
jgi:hypothetical protein